MTIRFYKARQREREEQVNKNAEKEQKKSIYLKLLTKENDELKCESARYQDQVKMLQKDIGRLQKEADSAHKLSDMRTAMQEFNEEPHVLIEKNILLQQEVNISFYQLLARSAGSVYLSALGPSALEVKRLP